MNVRSSAHFLISDLLRCPLSSCVHALNVLALATKTYSSDRGFITGLCEILIRMSHELIQAAEQTRAVREEQCGHGACAGATSGAVSTLPLPGQLSSMTTSVGVMTGQTDPGIARLSTSTASTMTTPTAGMTENAMCNTAYFSDACASGFAAATTTTTATTTGTVAAIATAGAAGTAGPATATGGIVHPLATTTRVSAVSEDGVTCVHSSHASSSPFSTLTNDALLSLFSIAETSIVQLNYLQLLGAALRKHCGDAAVTKSIRGAVRALLAILDKASDTTAITTMATSSPNPHLSPTSSSIPPHPAAHAAVATTCTSPNATPPTAFNVPIPSLALAVAATVKPRRHSVSVGDAVVTGITGVTGVTGVTSVTESINIPLGMSYVSPPTSSSSSSRISSLSVLPSALSRDQQRAFAPTACASAGNLDTSSARDGGIRSLSLPLSSSSSISSSSSSSSSSFTTSTAATTASITSTSSSSSSFLRRASTSRARAGAPVPILLPPTVPILLPPPCL